MQHNFIDGTTKQKDKKSSKKSKKEHQSDAEEDAHLIAPQSSSAEIGVVENVEVVEELVQEVS